MFAIGNLIRALATVLGYALDIYFWVVIIATLMTWVSPDPLNPIVRFLRSATEPVFGWFRRTLPFLRAGAFDLAALAVILVIIFMKVAVVDTLYTLGSKLQ
jgi:YggT family protein